MNIQLATLMLQMVELYHGDPRRIHHFVKVHNFAAVIGSLERLDQETQFILEAAAIVHDIGIHISEEKYGNCNGKNQEKEGPALAKIILEKVGGFSDAQIGRICYLVGHHHTYNGVDGLDYQILLEADFLVNAYEDELDKDAREAFVKKIFKTPTGKRLIGDMFRE